MKFNFTHSWHTNNEMAFNRSKIGDYKIWISYYPCKERADGKPKCCDAWFIKDKKYEFGDTLPRLRIRKEEFIHRLHRFSRIMRTRFVSPSGLL